MYYDRNICLRSCVCTFVTLTLVSLLLSVASATLLAQSSVDKLGEEGVIAKIYDKYKKIFIEYNTIIKDFADSVSVTVNYTFSDVSLGAGPPPPTTPWEKKALLLEKIDKMTEKGSTYAVFIEEFNKLRKEGNIAKDAPELIKEYFEVIAGATKKSLEKEISAAFKKSGKTFQYTPFPTPRIVTLYKSDSLKRAQQEILESSPAENILEDAVSKLNELIEKIKKDVADGKLDNADELLKEIQGLQTSLNTTLEENVKKLQNQVMELEKVVKGIKDGTIMTDPNAVYDNTFMSVRKAYIHGSLETVPTFGLLSGGISGVTRGGNKEEVKFNTQLSLSMNPFASQSFVLDSSFTSDYFRSEDEDSKPADTRDFRSTLSWYPGIRYENTTLTEHLEFNRLFYGIQGRFRQDAIKNFESKFIGFGGGLATKVNPNLLFVVSLQYAKSWNVENYGTDDETDETSDGYDFFARAKFAEGRFGLDITFEYYVPDFDTSDDNFVYVNGEMSYTFAQPAENVSVALTTKGKLDYRNLPLDDNRKADYTAELGVKFTFGSPGK